MIYNSIFLLLSTEIISIIHSRAANRREKCDWHRIEWTRTNEETEQIERAEILVKIEKKTLIVRARGENVKHKKKAQQQEHS